jgi:hypothetical protein
MSSAQYDLVFSGEIMPNADPEAARARLMERFGLGDEAAARLFSGGRVIVKRGVDPATAKRFRDAFAAAGAKLGVEPVGGAAERGAAPLSPQVPTDSEGLALAPLDAPLDEIDDRGPPRSPDTSQLRLVAGDDWTLVDCATHIEPQRVPDTAHLRLEPIAPIRNLGGD